MNYWLRDKDLNNTSAVLRIGGPDANTYLQGQVTQELRVGDGRVVYGLFLDQKGRVFADSHVMKVAENDYWVISFSAVASALRERLEAYLIADDVVIEDRTAEWNGFLLWGDELERSIAPPGVMALPSRRAGPSSRQWLAPVAVAETVADLLRASGSETDLNAATRARIEAAIPAVPADIGPRDLPNEGGLDEVAISYTKGCYLGQEVMARLKNLGQVRRRLHVVRGKGLPPVAGTALHQGERKVGEVRSSAAEADGFLAMAMLSLVGLDPTRPLRLASADGSPVAIVRRV